MDFRLGERSGDGKGEPACNRFFVGRLVIMMATLMASLGVDGGITGMPFRVGAVRRVSAGSFVILG